MAIGSQNSYEGKNVYFVRVITKDADKKPIKPYFSFVQKEGDKYVEKAKGVKFNGDITKVFTGKRTFNAVEQPETKITIEDGQDVYILSQNYTILSRSVFNSILSLDNTEGVTFTIYQTKPNAANKVFPQMSIWQNDVLVKWQYKLDEMPAVKKVRVKGADVSDTEEVDNFFVAKLNEKFSGGKAISSKKVDADTGDNPAVDEDVPF